MSQKVCEKCVNEIKKLFNLLCSNQLLVKRELPPPPLEMTYFQNILVHMMTYCLPKNDRLVITSRLSRQSTTQRL
jgi:hypothetical protein